MAGIGRFHFQPLPAFRAALAHLVMPAITLGLPILRTSVDHGTAFDIAGRGIANADSLVDAIEYAMRLVEGRRNKAAPDARLAAPADGAANAVLSTR